MKTFIVSDAEAITSRVRGIILREGIDCPKDHLLPMSVDMFHLRQQKPELIVLALQPNPEWALALLAHLRQLPSCEVIVVGPGEDSRLVRRVCHVGVRDYIDENELDAELTAAVERLRSEISAQDALGQVIAIFSPSGGCGISTMSVNLAALEAKEHGKSLLIDLNLQSGDLATLLDLQPTHTLVDLCTHADHLDRILLEQALIRHTSGVHLLASPSHIADAEYITSDLTRQIVTLGRNTFPAVVVDLGHQLTHALEPVYHLADVILLVLRLDFASLRNVRHVLEYFDQLQIGRERIRLVANRYGQPHEVPYRKAEEALGCKIAHYIPDDPSTVNRCNNCGVPVILERPYTKVSRSLANLAISLSKSVPQAELATVG